MPGATLRFFAKVGLVIVAAGALIAMYSAQLQLFRSPDYIDRPYLLLLAGLAILSVVLLVVPVPTLPIQLPQINKISVRWIWLVISITLALFAGWRARQDTTIWEQFVVWLLSMGTLAMAFARPTPRLDPLKRWEWLFVIGLLLAALLVRSVNVGSLPNMLDGDEARFADAGAVIAQSNWAGSPLRSGVDGYSNLQSSLIAVSVSILGTTLAAARIPSVVWGALTVPAIYLLGRELYSWKLGAAAAIFALGWALHAQFSRLGLNQVGDPLFGTLAFYFLVRGIRRATPLDYALAGIMLALSQMFYLAGLQYPFLLLAFLLWMAWQRRDLILPQWRLILIIPVTMLIAYFPRLYDVWQAHEQLVAHTQPNIFVGGYWAEAVDNDELGYFIHDQIFFSFEGLFSLADRTLWYGPGSNALSPVGGPLLLIGLAASLLMLRRYPLIALAAGWSFSAVFLGMTLSKYPPSYQRYVAGVPGFALLIGLGLVALSNLFARLLAPGVANRLFWTLCVVVGTASLIFYIGVYIPEGRYLFKLSVWASQHIALDMRDQIKAGRQGYLIDNYESGIEGDTPVFKYYMEGLAYQRVTSNVSISDGLKAIDNANSPMIVYVSPQQLNEVNTYLAQLPSSPRISTRQVDVNGEVAYYEIKVN